MERAAQASSAAPWPAVFKHLELLWTSCLAIGMVLSLTPQLRLGAVGPGELLILLWLLLGLMILLVGYRGEVPRALWDFVRFFASASLDDWSLAFHDIVAYLLLFVLTIVLFALPGASRRLHLIQWFTALFGTLLLALQAANALGAFTLNGIDPWYWDRLRGWSDNPNQFALMAMIIGFLALELAEHDVGKGAKLLALACAFISFGIGWFARSNAYTIVVLAAFGLFGLLKAARATRRAEREGFPAIALGIAALAALVFVSCLFAPAIGSGGDGSPLSLVARKGENQESEAKVRLYLWRQAIERGLDSWMIGYGPGPHLEIPASLTPGHRTANEPSNLSHPKEGVAPNYEAHNTFLELFVQGGVLAVGSFVWFGALAVRRAWKAGKDGLVALLFAVAAFGSFHVVFRHPIVWLAIGLALQAQQGFRQRVPTTSSGDRRVGRRWINQTTRARLQNTA